MWSKDLSGLLRSTAKLRGAVEVLNGMPCFRDREPAQKTRRLLALTSAWLQLGQARKEEGRDTLALAETLGGALVSMAEAAGRFFLPTAFLVDFHV